MSRVTENVPLTADTIADLDAGIFRAMINKEIEKAVNDLSDRGKEDGKVRKVNIQLEFALKDHDVDITATVEAKLPPRRTCRTVANSRMKSKGVVELQFMADTPGNPSQPSFLQDGEIDEN